MLQMAPREVELTLTVSTKAPASHSVSHDELNVGFFPVTCSKLHKTIHPLGDL